MRRAPWRASSSRSAWSSVRAASSVTTLSMRRHPPHRRCRAGLPLGLVKQEGTSRSRAGGPSTTSGHTSTELGVSHSTVARVWAEHDLKPWQTETFKFSTDPQLEAKVRDVVGLYLDPPAHAIVLCVDEKSQIQALERTQPVRPVAPGRAEQRTHDYVRHGTTTLFAALEVATGQVTDACHPRHRHSEFLDFLRLVAKAYPRRQLHVVLDNYATHKHVMVQAWLTRHPRIHLHFTPTYASWLNLVEVFFAIIQRQALRRGDFTSVDELIAAIRRFCDGWNQRCQPFAWAKDADQILTKLKRQNTSATNH